MLRENFDPRRKSLKKNLGGFEMKLGFIGGGMIAQSILRGVLAKNLFKPEEIFIAEVFESTRNQLQQKYSVNVAENPDSFDVDILILAVKPKDAKNALKKLQIDSKTILISVVAGLRLEVIESIIGEQKIIRVMPNVALSVGEGMSGMSPNRNITKEDLSKAESIFKSCGRAVQVEEKLMDAVTGLSGSAPAYAFLIIDALAEGGVASGLPRNTATELAAQTLFGAAKMVLETQEHPDALRDRVTSPGGTTIEGVRVLENFSVRAAMIEAVIAGTEKSKDL